MVITAKADKFSAFFLLTVEVTEVTEVTRAPQIRGTHQEGRVQRCGDGLGTPHGLKTASTSSRFKVITAKADKFIGFFFFLQLRSLK